MRETFINTLIMCIVAAFNTAASVFIYEHTDLSATMSVFVCSWVAISLGVVLVSKRNSDNVHYTEVNIQGAEHVETLEKTNDPKSVKVKVEKTCKVDKKTQANKKRSEAAKRRKRENGRFV